MKICIMIIILNSVVSCAAIKKNTLSQYENSPSMNQLSYSLSFVGKSNNSVVQEYEVQDDMINYIGEDCLEGKLKMNRPNFKDHIVWARFICEISDNLKFKNKITEGTLVKKISPTGLHLHISYEQNVLERKELIYLGLFSLMIIPFKNEVFHKWTSEVYRDGKLIKTYSYEDGFSVWHSILLLPISPFVDGYNESIKKLNTSFTNNLVHDLQRDKLL